MLATIVPFVLASVVILVIPGPAVLYIVARSVEQGRSAGLVSACGVGVGNLVHVTAATLGLSALLVSSALAFTVVKYLGAAYLIFLGIRTLFARAEHEQVVAREPQTLARVFAQGVLVNVFNPKVALFFFAFLPQFVDLARGSIAAQTLGLGCLYTLIAIGSDSLWALLAGTAAAWLRGNARFLRTRRFVTGTVYLGLGVATAVAGSQKT